MDTKAKEDELARRAKVAERVRALEAASAVGTEAELRVLSKILEEEKRAHSAE